MTANANDPNANEDNQIVAKNTVERGAFSNEGLLLDEDPVEFAQFAEAVLLQYRPVGPVEKTLVNTIVWTLWRMLRMPRIEAGRHVFERYARYLQDSSPRFPEGVFYKRVKQATAVQHDADPESIRDLDPVPLEPHIKELV